MRYRQFLALGITFGAVWLTQGCASRPMSRPTSGVVTYADSQVSLDAPKEFKVFRAGTSALKVTAGHYVAQFRPSPSYLLEIAPPKEIPAKESDKRAYIEKASAKIWPRFKQDGLSANPKPTWTAINGTPTYRIWYDTSKDSEIFDGYLLNNNYRVHFRISVPKEKSEATAIRSKIFAIIPTIQLKPKSGASSTPAAEPIAESS